MPAYQNYWKIWLRPNLLTKDVENDYIAEVSTKKNTLRNTDIAQRIISEGSEIKYDTLLSIINQHDRISRQALMDGYSVLTGTCQFTPRVTGTWIGESAQFDPVIHHLTLDIIPSREMREALELVGVEILAVKEGGAFIGLVTDTFTGLTDNTATVGEDIRIEGNKIKVEGEEGQEVGIFFVDDKDVAVPVTRRLTQNDPKTIIARVPATLAPGSYTLRIVTQHSNGTVLLKQVRTIEYGYPLVVKAAE